jgi:hypothetical protein
VFLEDVDGAFHNLLRTLCNALIQLPVKEEEHETQRSPLNIGYAEDLTMLLDNVDLDATGTLCSDEEI